jgi:uncharacterized protein involved in exopolysaccharide biosynthesis
MIFAFISQPVYEAKAKILILPTTAEGLIISTGSEIERVDKVSREDINTEMELFTSEDVIRDTVAYFTDQGKSIGIKKEKKAWYRRIIAFVKRGIDNLLIFLKLKEPLSDFDANVKQLSSAIQVEPVAMSNIIIVELRSEKQEEAAIILNRLVHTYIKHHNEVFSKDDGVGFFNDQATEYHRKLEQAEKQLKDLQSEWQIIDLEDQYKAKIDQLSTLSQDLRNVEVSIDETEAKLSMLLKGIQKDVEITKEMRLIPSIVELEKALVPLYIQRGEVLKSFTKSSREYRNVDSQIRSIQEQIKTEVLKAINTEELELNSLRAKQGSINEKLEMIREEADDLVQKERFLNDLNRKVTLLQENYLLYASKTEDARIFSERKKRNLANVSIAEHATRPAKATFPKTKLMLVVSIIIGFFAAIGVPFTLEFLDHRIKTSQEVENFLSLPVICTLPEVKEIAVE